MTSIIVGVETDEIAVKHSEQDFAPHGENSVC